MKKITFIGLAGESVFMTVDHFNATGETVRAETIHCEPGGKGYNQAIAAARLGADCTFIGAFGRDAEGEFCIGFAKSEGITVCPIYKENATAYACILTDKTGENRVTVYGGAAGTLNGDDVFSVSGQIADSAMLVLQNEVPQSANLAAFEIARKNNIPVLLNPAPADGIDTALVRGAYVITPNEQEAQTLFGDNWRDGMRMFGIQRAVVTLGGDGCDVYESGKWTHIPSKKVQAVDTTGAGDCFTGTLAVKLVGGATLIEAAEFAVRASALSVCRRFAVGGMPKLDELE